ncbi:PREDICTED: receptor-like kinase TMK4 [Nelumbo nucifera]|uniref:non-specific serine/threonine protein kinase n=1 Tax=Nelumbo nucifera TaxID=4432 RepID=A0A1U7Z7P9_NELNU|nr:PREDICTED: receptor-like kinase TMK4 [Nelumbo nucifera]
MRGRRKFISHLLFFLFSVFNLVSIAISDDAAIMGKLAASLSGHPPDWSGNDPCIWTGITCDNTNRVTGINLPKKSLGGSLPPDLNQLTQLRLLYLQNNAISGDLPSLANLTNLIEINLNSNKFTSVPDTFLTGLTSLQLLSISNNTDLAPWSIPVDLAQSTTLVTFYASRANIMGMIPDIFGSFPNLLSLRLSYNSLTGPLPPSLGGTKIQNLWLDHQASGLAGTIEVLGTMTQISQVWLQTNKFTGPIPDLSKCTALFDLQLRDNRFTGVVPETLMSLPSLLHVSLSSNMFQGPLPQFKSNVEVILGSGNRFCSKTPGPCDPQVTVLLAMAGGFGYPMSLAEAWVGNNACHGWAFITCDSQKNVTVISLGKQQLSGTISPAISNLTSLRMLFLNDNNLTGPIPESLTTLPKLQTLDVTNNNLTGKIPVFPAGVLLKMSGNPLLGAHRGTSPGLIAGIVIVSLVFLAIAFFVYYKYYVNKRSQKIEPVESSHANANEEGKSGMFATSGFGGGSEHYSNEDASSDIRFFEGGSVVIPIEVLRQITNNFSEEKELGRGGFGIVYKGEMKDGTQVAVKRMESSLMGTKGMNEFQSEIAVLSKLRHRSLVALLGHCINGNERLLVYEYMPQGTLGEHLFEWKTRRYPPLTWKQRVAIALDMARGVEYLHTLAQQSFIHRDLKPTNILLGDDMRAKVADFGLVKNAPDGNFSIETRLAGTFGYLAPEYAATGRVTTKVDVYAFGVVLMEIITGRKALDETMPAESCHLVSWFRRILINKDIRSAIDSTLDPDDETFASICKVADLAGHCTAREPFQRPDMGHAVNVLCPLVEQWKPSSSPDDDDDDDEGDINFHMETIQKWDDD